MHFISPPPSRWKQGDCELVCAGVELVPKGSGGEIRLRDEWQARIDSTFLGIRKPPNLPPLLNLKTGIALAK